MGNGWYEIRAHVLSEDKTTVLKTFTLGYPPWASKEDALRTTSNNIKEGEKEFIVRSYNPFTVQRVMLYKEK